MPENWKTYKLSEVFEIIGGGTPKTKIKEYWDGNIPWLSVVDFNNDNRTVNSTEKSITELGLQKSSTKILSKGQLIISARGTVGQIAQLGRNMAFNQSCYGLSGKEELLINDFGYYLLKSSITNIQANSHGSVFDTITRNTFDNIDVSIPEIEEQKQIASILSALDDKIESNLQMNKTLEEMAMALYKHWFVDFEPFRDGKFVTTEFGEIPKGWEVKTLGDEFKITIGRTPPRKENEWFSSEGGIKWISIKDMGNCGTYIFNTSEYLTAEAVQRKKVPQVPANTVILSFKLTVGRVAITTENMVTNEAIAHFLKKKNTLLSSEYLYSALKLFDYNSLGSTSSIATAVNSKTVKSMKILVPSKSVLDNFQQEIVSFFELIKTNSEEIQSLTQLRDTLLPKLISGEVRVKDGEKTLTVAL